MLAGVIVGVATAVELSLLGYGKFMGIHAGIIGLTANLAALTIVQQATGPTTDER